MYIPLLNTLPLLLNTMCAKVRFVINSSWIMCGIRVMTVDTKYK